MENTIEIIIKPKHFRNAVEFSDNDNCPLALAVKEHFKDKYLSVCPDYLYDKKNKIIYSLYWGFHGPESGLGRDKNGKAITVDYLIKLAKQKKKVGSYTVILTKFG